jgi:hypothetical protein
LGLLHVTVTRNTILGALADQFGADNRRQTAGRTPVDFMDRRCRAEETDSGWSEGLDAL